MLLKVCANAELVFQDNFAEVFDTSGQILNPSCSSLELVGRSNVEAEVSVQDGDDIIRRHVFGKKLRVSRLSSTVPADKDIEAFLGGDEAKVLVLRFGTFTYTARNAALEFVRSSNTLVPLLESDGHANTVTDTEAAPSRSYAGLDSTQRFCVSMTGFHTAVHEFPPDLGQVVFLRPEHVDTLTTGDLAVKTILLRHGANDDELLRGDLASGDTGNDGESTVSFCIVEVSILFVRRGESSKMFAQAHGSAGMAEWAMMMAMASLLFVINLRMLAYTIR